MLDIEPEFLEDEALDELYRGVVALKLQILDIVFDRGWDADSDAHGFSTWELVERRAEGMQAKLSDENQGDE